MARVKGQMDAHILFFKPKNFPSGWEKTDEWRFAESIPGVEALSDEDGAEAQFFKAATSGQVMVYGPQGRLLFFGGITESRGHSGDNLGRSAIESLVVGGRQELFTTAVFGCSIRHKDLKDLSPERGLWKNIWNSTTN